MACGRRFGKTVLGLDLAIRTALSGYPVGWFAPEYSLLREAWRDLKDALEQVGKANEQEKRLTLINGGSIDCWSFDRNPNAGRSRKYKRVIIDEAAHCRDLGTTWRRAIRATLTDFQGDAWFLSSPNGQNEFYRLFCRQGEHRKGWKSWQLPSWENPLLARSEIDDAREDLDDWAFRQEYGAEFLAESVGQLIPVEWVERCVTATRKGDSPRMMAIDVAKGTGRDRTVICVADDFGVLRWVVSSVTTIPEAARIAAQVANEMGVRHDRIVYDAGGWGGSDMTRYLNAANIFAAQAYYGSASGGYRFNNLRTASAWRLRQRLDPTRPQRVAPWRPNLGAIASRRPTPTGPDVSVQLPFTIPSTPEWPEVRADLLELRYGFEGRKTALEKKEDLVARIGHSPDLVDCLIMLASLWPSDD